MRRFGIRNLEGLKLLFISISEGDPTSLDHLDIRECADLEYIRLPTFKSARYYIHRCRKLKLLAQTLSSLENLSLEGCSELLFQGDGLPSNLHGLQISFCNQLTTQEDWGLQRLNSLTILRIIGGCQEFHSFPKECLLSSTITTLVIEHLSNLKSLDSKGLQQLNSLSNLSISHCPEFQSFGEEGLQHLTYLTTLSISGCPELESLTEAGLCHLISLENLQISNCLKLQYLTKERLSNSLSCLITKECPLLEHHCQFGKDQDWQYIAHIPHILINKVLY